MKNWKLLSACVVVSGFVAATPAKAEDWRLCYAIGCLNNQCGDWPTKAYVITPVQFDDPGYGGEAEMMRQLEEFAASHFPRGEGWEYGTKCSDPQPSNAVAMEGGKRFVEAVRGKTALLFGPPSVVWRYNAAGESSDTQQADADETGNRESAEADTTEQDDARTNSADADREAQAEAAKQRQAERDRQYREAEEQRKAAIAKADADERAAEEVRRKEREAATAELIRKQDERNRKMVEEASTNTDANRCVTSADLRNNDTFPGNTAAYVVNGCGQKVDIRICLMTEAKGWNCGVSWGVAPQQRWSHSSFHATGQVFVSARTTGSNQPLAQPN